MLQALMPLAAIGVDYKLQRYATKTEACVAGKWQGDATVNSV
jgi:hypothetical protein